MDWDDSTRLYATAAPAAAFLAQPMGNILAKWVTCILSSGIVSFLTCPFWVLRTRMQAEVFRPTGFHGVGTKYPKTF